MYRDKRVCYCTFCKFQTTRKWIEMDDGHKRSILSDKMKKALNLIYREIKY